MFKRLLPVLLALCVPLLLAGPAMASFGLERFAEGATSQSGPSSEIGGVTTAPQSPDVQAGSHPYALTTSFLLNEPKEIETSPGNRPYVREGDLRDVGLELPPGFVGNPNAVPHCSYQEFINTSVHAGGGCSDETAIGIASTYFTSNKESEGEEGVYVFAVNDPVYNLVPPTGVAAQFGFIVASNTPVLLDSSVRAGSDYGLTTTVSGINQSLVVYGSKVSIWGVPADPIHNPVRGDCLSQTDHGGVGAIPPGMGEGEDERESPFITGFTNGLPESYGDCPTQAPVTPLLTNPTSCGQPRIATLGVDDWQEPGNFATGEHVSSKTVSLPELSGCEKLDFSPTLGVKPDSEAGSSPAGLNVNLDVPQEATENPVGDAEADVKDTTVTLPPGVQLSPSAADGLQACSNAQIGFTEMKELNPSSEPGVQTPQFKEKVDNPATGREEATLCPDASKIATVKIKTPLLEGELEGSVFLASPQNFAGLPENPFGSLVAMYLVAEEPKAGVIVKLPGHVELGEAGVSNGLQPGQIRTTFDNTPQLPFSELKLEFYGTNRAPLATPAFCGTYKTEASLQPWSGTPAVSPVADFNIDSGPNGSSCPGSALPFSPTLASGVTNINAGSFSDLTTTLGREDGQQNIQSVTLHYPPGVSGILSGIPLCGEAQANAGTCSAASEIGETIVSVGLGGDPFSVTGGKVYLTGPYNGSGACTVGEAGCAPFGLSIVNPAKAGPFDLQEGRPVVVRAKIEVDPHTAALTVTTDGSGEHAIPHIIDGIPLQIKHVNVNITRQGFTFNPTSCNPTKVEGTINSAENASSPVSVPFQVTNCQALKFAPKFAVSTPGRTSKADGAGLTATLSYPIGSFGTASEIAKVKVDLPKQLPSRLTTLQKACTNAQFELNPANCPSASKIGYATVTTPLLPVPLTGPAIFVSHGGEAFPSLTMVLQGYGVTIDLVGTTFISHAGITSTTFKTVPDVPFNTFTLTLAQGKYSALAANLPTKDNGSFCGQTLTMPTAFVGQNGMEIHETTPVSVTGCAKVKVLTKAQKLSKVLKACKKKKGAALAKCEAAARRQYGAAKKKTKRKK